MIYLLTTERVFLVLVLAVAFERISELRIAKRNVKSGLKRGAQEFGRGHYPVMVALHTGFLISAVAEVFLLGRPFVRGLALFAIALLFVSMTLRYWVIATLGPRWTTRVLWVPGEEPVRGGSYRFFRHPNYVAVILEIFALPMIHTAWFTALVFSLLNAWLLAVRIRLENRVIDTRGGAL